MISQAFIFSEKKSDRIKRHLLFWIFWWIYYGTLHAALPSASEKVSYFQNLPFTISESLLHIVPQLLLAYPLLYFVLPKYILTNKYAEAFVWVFVFMLLSGLVNLYMTLNLNQKILSAVLPEQYMQHTNRTRAMNFGMALLSSLKGGLTSAAIAVGIKMVKYWYLKEKRNLQLQKERTEVRLQLLTAQIHPHFLFNTLNNIYSQTQDESPKGSAMIMGLSDLLRYILYEGQKALVPLHQELKMVKEYIQLEKLRYGNKLEVHLQMPDNPADILIAPLILLPFIENCFKHGASKILQSPWVNLSVVLKDETLTMKLMNGKVQLQNHEKEQPGIGIKNVRQRLDLLYTGKYNLKISEDEEVFVVDLWVKLTRMQNKEVANSFSTAKSAIQHV